MVRIQVTDVISVRTFGTTPLALESPQVTTLLGIPESDFLLHSFLDSG
jgi:hypothetical protein